MGTIFVNQKLTMTLIAKDNDGTIIPLTGRTVHYLTRDPSGNVSTDTGPTIDDPTNGKVVHIYVANDLNKSGKWQSKLLIVGDEVPSTRYEFSVHERWNK